MSGSRPAALAAPLVAHAGLADGGGVVLDQLALAHLLATGAYDRHVRAARLRYRAKRAALLEALAAELPAARVRGVAAGLSALVELPPGTDDLAVAATCLERGVRVYPLRWHALAPAAQPPALVLGYAAPTERELREAVTTIATAVAEATTRARRSR